MCHIHRHAIIGSRGDAVVERNSLRIFLEHPDLAQAYFQTIVAMLSMPRDTPVGHKQKLPRYDRFLRS